jgi:protein involved in polysaccharide export with SLBB domain
MPRTYSDWCQIEMLEKRQVIVRGEVEHVGVHGIGSNATVISSIATAGGFTFYANSARVILSRGEITTEHNTRKDNGAQTEVKPGDTVTVTRSYTWGTNPREIVYSLPKRWKTAKQYYDRRMPNQ